MLAMHDYNKHLPNCIILPFKLALIESYKTFDLWFIIFNFNDYVKARWILYWNEKANGLIDILCRATSESDNIGCWGMGGGRQRDTSSSRFVHHHHHHHRRTVFARSTSLRASLLALWIVPRTVPRCNFRLPEGEFLRLWSRRERNMARRLARSCSLIRVREAYLL